MADTILHPSAPPAALVDEIAAQCSRRVQPDFAMLESALRARVGESLAAIILYGSTVRAGSLDGMVVDFYAVVDDYHGFHRSGPAACLNAFLPPNVYYLEVPAENAVLRAKFALITLSDFEKGTSVWFHSYIWARFAQPARLLYWRDDAARDRIRHALAGAVMTFLRETLPVLGPCDADVETIWICGLTLSYEAELRPERSGQARELTHLSLGDYQRLTAAAAPALPELVEPLARGRFRCRSTPAAARRALRRWRLRRIQGRILSLFRLAKAAFTFRDCVDYAAWKVERHTGVRMQVTPRLRRHPLLFGWRVIWQLLRRGALR